MSLLTPLYVLGALAIAAPIVFHLIRRTPRGEVPFSSLMFLSPSPPRLTRRSRLDDLLLLLLGGGAGLAGVRIRPAVPPPAAGVLRRRAAADRGAHRHQRQHAPGRPWARAQALADEAIDDCRPGDQLAIFAFDVDLAAPVGFAESATLDPARRQAVARAVVGRLAPAGGRRTWGGPSRRRRRDRGRGRRQRQGGRRRGGSS